MGLGSAGWHIDNNNSDYRKSHTFAIRDFPNFELLAGVDTDSFRRKSWSSITGRPTFANIEEALSLNAFDIIVIATPIPTLFSILKACLHLSPESRIIVEKPVINASSDYASLVELSDMHGDRILVNLPRLFALESYQIRDLVCNWHVTSISGTYSGTFNNTVLHLITLLSFWFPYLDVRTLDKVDSRNLTILRDGSLLGTIEHSSLIDRSSFNLAIADNSRILRYQNGGEDIWHSAGDGFTEIFNSRNIYQRNVYEFINQNGFSSAVKISGLREVLPSITRMFKPY